MRYGKIGLFLMACGLFFSSVDAINRRENKSKSKPMELVSYAFKDGDKIPLEYTCDNKEFYLSPPLKWTNAPAATRSFAITCIDIDALKGKFVHWVVFNIPADITEFSENARLSEMGIMQGLNGYKEYGYVGMCPPLGRHRYVFKVYALDSLLMNLDRNATYSNLLNNIHGHVLATASLMGIYERSYKVRG